MLCPLTPSIALNTKPSFAMPGSQACRSATLRSDIPSIVRPTSGSYTPKILATGSPRAPKNRLKISLLAYRQLYCLGAKRAQRRTFAQGVSGRYRRFSSSLRAGSNKRYWKEGRNPGDRLTVSDASSGRMWNVLRPPLAATSRASRQVPTSCWDTRPVRYPRRSTRARKVPQLITFKLSLDVVVCVRLRPSGDRLAPLQRVYYDIYNDLPGFNLSGAAAWFSPRLFWA